MNKYNPDIHHRRSIRLRGYDYAQAGLYFITLCVQHRECLFGRIENIVGADLRVCPQMILNGAGQMVVKWYHELENKFPGIKCHEMVVMPNHFHCIVENTGAAVDAVGADLRVCPKNIPGEQTESGEPSAEPLGETMLGETMLGETSGETLGETLGEHIGSPLHCVVQWFKTMSTNEYIRGVKNCGWPRFNGKLWQRNYYEHIIRNEKSYQTISNYILNNPANWNADKLNHQQP